MEELVLIRESNANDARKKIDASFKAGKKIILRAGDDEFNRRMIESGKIAYILGLEEGFRNDKLKQRDSGFNQVMAKIARDNHVILGIDFENFIKLKGKELIFYVERVLQNIKICNKYNVKIVLFNCKRKKNKDLVIFLLNLGMSTSMAKYAVDNCVNI